MLNYFNFKEFDNKYLITNDLGRYDFLTKLELHQMITNQVEMTSPLYDRLRDKHFIYNEDAHLFVEEAGMELRYFKKYLFKSTALHIFVVTKRCNQSCVYCQASSSNESNTYMTIEIAKAAVDIAISSPTKNLTFEFQGGEPLLNFDVIKYIIEYTESTKADKNIEYVIVTNLTIFKDEMLPFLDKYNVNVSTSLDGNLDLHSKNRPMNNGGVGAYEKVIRSISLLKQNRINVSAIQTTTKDSLNNYISIIDQYIACGLKTIFLRPLTPLGFATQDWDNIGYSPDEFISFFKSALVYIIQKNIDGIKISEGHTRIFLKKILNHDSMNFMELRSPCGGGIGQIAYYYDGSIYTCDEARMLAEMGDESFKMGEVLSSNYNDLMNSDACKTVCVASCLESHTQCADCVYSPYCGTCPVISLALTGSPFSQMKSDYRCKVYQGILDTIFEILLRNENDVINIFRSWIN
jgi:His-Xaa-Ser system radical SAM maturase HxsB